MNLFNVKYSVHATLKSYWVTIPGQVRSDHPAKSLLIPAPTITWLKGQILTDIKGTLWNKTSSEYLICRVQHAVAQHFIPELHSLQFRILCVFVCILSLQYPACIMQIVQFIQPLRITVIKKSYCWRSRGAPAVVFQKFLHLRDSSIQVFFPVFKRENLHPETAAAPL